MNQHLIEAPVFLVGSERSGTTMLRLMLQHHPRIAFASEHEFMVDLVSDKEGDGWPDLDATHAYLQEHRVFQLYGLEIDRSLAYPDLMRSFLRQTLERKGGDVAVLGATVHHHFDRLLRLWPEARFIHLLRDPRDVSRSVIGMGWAGNVWTASQVWIEAEHCWDTLRSRIGADRFVELRYEPLVSNPVGELSRICGFLGLEYDAEMLRYSEHSTYDAPDPKLTYQWKRKLSEREVQLVESRTGELLEARGYQPSGLPPIQVSEAEQRKLLRQDHWARFKHRLAFMGPPLFTIDYIARRIGPPRSAGWSSVGSTRRSTPTSSKSTHDPSRRPLPEPGRGCPGRRRFEHREVRASSSPDRRRRPGPWNHRGSSRTLWTGQGQGSA